MAFTWYDGKGVQENYNQIKPFTGQVVKTEQGFFVRLPEMPSWATSDDGRYQALLRYDDHDTKISERLEVKDDYFYRMLNSVTDGLYVDRSKAVRS